MVCHDTAKFSGYKHFGSGDKNDFSLFHDLARPRFFFWKTT